MSNPTSIAAANALSGEKTFATVQYPLTGDPALDAISGCIAVMEQKIPLDPSTYCISLTSSQRVAILKYLLDRFTNELESIMEAEKANRETRAKISPYPTAPFPYSPVPGPYPLTTTFPQAVSGGPHSLTQMGSAGNYPPGILNPVYDVYNSSIASQLGSAVAELKDDIAAQMAAQAAFAPETDPDKLP